MYAQENLLAQLKTRVSLLAMDISARVAHIKNCWHGEHKLGISTFAHQGSFIFAVVWYAINTRPVQQQKLSEEKKGFTKIFRRQKSNFTFSIFYFFIFLPSPRYCCCLFKGPTFHVLFHRAQVVFRPCALDAAALNPQNRPSLKHLSFSCSNHSATWCFQ